MFSAFGGGHQTFNIIPLFPLYVFKCCPLVGEHTSANMHNFSADLLHGNLILKESNSGSQLPQLSVFIPSVTGRSNIWHSVCHLITLLFRLWNSSGLSEHVLLLLHHYMEMEHNLQETAAFYFPCSVQVLGIPIAKWPLWCAGAFLRMLKAGQ